MELGRSPLKAPGSALWPRSPGWASGRPQDLKLGNLLFPWVGGRRAGRAARRSSGPYVAATLGSAWLWGH